jgi:hypothetical protein
MIVNQLSIIAGGLPQNKLWIPPDRYEKVDYEATMSPTGLKRSLTIIGGFGER